MLSDITAFFSDTMVIWIPLILGAVFLGFGVTTLRRVLALRSNGVRVPGRITGKRTSSGGNGGFTSAAVFEFTTLDGRHIRTSQPVSTSPNLLRTGRPVTVAYDEQDPERAEILESASQVVGGVVFTAVGAVALLAAVIITLVVLG